MPQRIDGEIDIEVRPVQVVCTWQLYVADLSNRGVFEPRKLLERHEELLLADEHFNLGSASSKRVAARFLAARTG